MTRIEWNTVSGIEIVKEFGNVEVIDDFDIDDLKQDFEGTRGAEVTAEVLEEIHDAYGVAGMHIYTIYGHFCKSGEVTFTAENEERAWEVFFGMDFDGYGVPENKEDYSIRQW